MKEEVMNVKVYIADDGKKFFDEEKCRKYDNIVKNIRYFIVRHSPDLTETGLFRSTNVAAVYSENGYHREILERWCVDEWKFPIIGVSVQGYGFQPHFAIMDDPGGLCWNEFVHDKVVDSFRYKSKIFLSPIRVEDFPNNTDYYEKWFK
jgi:hypothetical protein